MHVRIVHSQLRPETITEATHLWQERVAPRLKAQPGCVRTTLFGNSDTGRAQAMTVWQSEADALAYEASPLSDELVGLFTSYFTAPPTMELYELMGES